MSTITLEIAPDEISPLTAPEVMPNPDVWEDWDWDDEDDEDWWEDDYDDDDDFYEDDEFDEEEDLERELAGLPF